MFSSLASPTSSWTVSTPLPGSTRQVIHLPWRRRGRAHWVTKHRGRPVLRENASRVNFGIYIAFVFILIFYLFFDLNNLTDGFPSHDSARQCFPQRVALLKSILNFIKKAISETSFSDTIRHCESSLRY